jgi:voltage-gated potassium channel Kch
MTAGAARARVLVVALKDPETTRNIIGVARKHFPHLQIFLRAHSRVEAYEYLEAGEERVYRETLDTSLRLGTDVLRSLGMPAYTAHRAAKLYRRADETFLRKMVEHRKKDRAAFLNAARESQAIFESVMRADPLGTADEAWTPPPAGEVKEKAED